MSSRRISPEEFEAYVDEGLSSVPEPFRKYLDNVVVAVDEEPSPEDYADTGAGGSVELFGIFRGVPFFDRQTAVSSLPAQIAIFRGPILRSFASRGEAVRAIRDTVAHEVGHMLGLSDAEMPY